MKDQDKTKEQLINELEKSSNSKCNRRAIRRFDMCPGLCYAVGDDQRESLPADED